jgi:hypothetical protein
MMKITDKEVIINGQKLYGNRQYNPDMPTLHSDGLFRSTEPDCVE